MNRFILFLLLLTAVSYSTDVTACIVLPQNTVNVSGPTTVCASSPTVSYNVAYSTSNNDSDYSMLLFVQGGTVSNFQPYTSVGGVPLGEGCVPTLTASNPSDCTIEDLYLFSVPPACRGGVSFDVTFSSNCASPGFVECVLGGSSTNVSDDVQIFFNPNCLVTQVQDGDLTQMDLSEKTTKLTAVQNRSGAVETVLKEKQTVELFPNPTMGSAAVTIKLPTTHENYEVRLTDVNGRLVSQYQNVNADLLIQTDQLSKGLYFVQVTADGFSDTQKLVIEQ